ncbi:MAG TPA: NADH-quinone oxidoreductase subunit M, partial [Anaerolineae bacterium]|nr:NADH-quinone oxidoreductase subunit M [Anaerolineae bacterium]
MNRLGFPLLSILILVPFAGALVTLAVGRSRRTAWLWALVVSLAALALAGAVWGLFDYGRGGPESLAGSMQFVDRVPWIETLGISYYVGVDGISLWLLLLTTFLVPIAIVASWRLVSHWPVEDVRAYFFWLLALETGVLGVFAAVDLVLFFVFWEAMLVPAYFLIGRWGGERRMYATLKFFLYTMAGSALMLVAILVLAALGFQQTGELTFDLLALNDLSLGFDVQIWLFLAFALAFAVKAPVWPFHGWLPPAYVESPTPVTILLAGILSKMGIYGLIRFCIPLFPDALAVARPWIWPLVVVGIVYASLVALVQSDMKRLIAYSSMAHVGIIVAGVLAANVQGVQGALLQSVSHGITVSALFLIVEFLAVRRGTSQIETFGGLWQSMPLLGTLTLTVMMASIGLPGLSGFPGEFTLLLG